MPASRLRTNVSERIPKFSVVGKYPADTGTLFVQHVALLRADAEIRYATPDVQVWHMGPPLVAGPLSSIAARREVSCTIHLAGTVELDAQDIEGIETWLAEADKENRPTGAFGDLQQYIVHPPVHWVRAENGIRLYRKFSCAGFVMECYRSVDINLIDDSNVESLPEIDLETVAHAYGDTVRREKIRERFGIPDTGPWRIVLAGYIMHALDRPDAAIRNSPHMPKSVAEKDFPLR